MSESPLKPVSRVCPECGVSLSGLDVEAHSLTHWPDNLDPARSSKLARARQAQLAKGGVSLSEYEKAHAEE